MGDVEEMIGELEEEPEEEPSEAEEKPKEKGEDETFGLDLDAAWSSTEREE